MIINGLFLPILSLQSPDNAFSIDAVLSAIPSINDNVVLDAPIEIRNNHRKRPERERHEESGTYDAPITVHLVMIFYDLMEEANGLTGACVTLVGVSKGAVPSELLLVD